jgi:hypothetical protein
MRFGESTKAALDQMPSRPKLTPVEGNPFARQTEAAPPTQQHKIADVKYRGPVDLAPFKCDSISRSSFIQRVCYDEKNSYMLINLSGTCTTIAKLIRRQCRAS